MWFEGDKYFADTLDKGHKQADFPIFQQTKNYLLPSSKMKFPI